MKNDHVQKMLDIILDEIESCPAEFAPALIAEQVAYLCFVRAAQCRPSSPAEAERWGTVAKIYALAHQKINELSYL